MASLDEMVSFMMMASTSPEESASNSAFPLL